MQLLDKNGIFKDWNTLQHDYGSQYSQYKMLRISNLYMLYHGIGKPILYKIIIAICSQ